MRLPSKTFWESRKVLVTGHTGFKGSWLSFNLLELGAEVHGLALDPNIPQNLYSALNLSENLASDWRVDIRDYARVLGAIEAIQPEVVFHLAAQALVGEGYRSPLGTLSTNVMGTANLLEATRGVGKRTVFISVTTDKVYANSEAGQSFAEHFPLGGHDPYSASKAAADIISQMFNTAYLRESGVAVGIARAGNVIGGGDWSEDRLFPDLARAWSSNRPVKLRIPHATRPWQHVLEPLRGYMVLAEVLESNPGMSGPFNFGPDADDSLDVEQVVSIASGFWPANSGWIKDPEERFHEAKNLSIVNLQTKELLRVGPIWRSPTAIERTTQWYHDYHSGSAATGLCREDIHAYQRAVPQNPRPN